MERSKEERTKKKRIEEEEEEGDEEKNGRLSDSVVRSAARASLKRKERECVVGGADAPTTIETENGSSEKRTTTVEDQDKEENDVVIPPRFYDWKTYYPQLQILLDNLDVLKKEMENATSWQLWPEDLYDRMGGDEWRVFPFLHTFPATDPSKMEWVGPNMRQCPKTVALLKTIPIIRTALYSRMGPKMKLTPHRGWAALSNHVLRCHISLDIPEPRTSGVWVRGSKRFHADGNIVVFDDSQLHSGFNFSGKKRCVLIIDLLRPGSVPRGVAVGAMTSKLQEYIAYFKKGINAQAAGAELFR